MNYILTFILLFNNKYSQCYDNYNKYDKEEEPTILDILDERVYNGIVFPYRQKPHKLFEDFQIMMNYFKRVKATWVNRTDPEDETLRQSAVTMFLNGGPTHTRLSIPRNTPDLKKTYNWTDEQINIVSKLQDESELYWNETKMTMKEYPDQKMLPPTRPPYGPKRKYWEEY